MSRFVLNIVNNGLKRLIDTETLAACLRGDIAVDSWREHVVAFFTEVPLTRIHGFIGDHSIPIGALRNTYDRLQSQVPEPAPEVVQWLDDALAAARTRPTVP